MCAEDIKQYVVIGMLGSRLHFKVALQQKCVRSDLFLVVTFNSDFILIELQEIWQLWRIIRVTPTSTPDLGLNRGHTGQKQTP